MFFQQYVNKLCPATINHYIYIKYTYIKNGTFWKIKIFSDKRFNYLWIIHTYSKYVYKIKNIEGSFIWKLKIIFILKCSIQGVHEISLNAQSNAYIKNNLIWNWLIIQMRLINVIFLKI